MKPSLAIVLLAGLLLLPPALAQQGFGQAPAGYPQQQQPQQAQPMDYPGTPQQGAYPQGAYPQGAQPGYPNTPSGGYAQPPASSSMPQGGGHPMRQMGPDGMQAMGQAQAILQAETRDFGVPAPTQLHHEFHAPTPNSIPGGQLITTDRLLALYQQGQQNGLLVFDVLGAGPGQMLPMAQNAVGAAQPGSFNDQTQQQFGQYLEQVTQGSKGRPMVFYCQGVQCWMSYNAALRAIQLGYTQVYWYRGGVEAWQQMQQVSMSMPQMPPGQAMPANHPGQSGAYPQYPQGQR